MARPGLRHGGAEIFTVSPASREATLLASALRAQELCVTLVAEHRLEESAEGRTIRETGARTRIDVLAQPGDPRRHRVWVRCELALE